MIVARDLALTIFREAVASADPSWAVKRYLSLSGEVLKAKDRKIVVLSPVVPTGKRKHLLRFRGF